MAHWNLPPQEIEKQSFAMIDQEAGDHGWPADAWTVVRRMVHTSADFEYVRSVRMHEQAVQAGVRAIRRGALIVTDTRMALSGISKSRLELFGARTACLIDHPDVAARAREEGITRAMAAMDKALADDPPGIFAIGNAPTALFRLIERIGAGAHAPDLIVGLPVGFVNAAESKEALQMSGLCHITALGRKGGSNVAAAVINALAVLAAEPDHDA